MFIGIDLTSSDKKPSALIGLNADLSLAFKRLLGSDDEIVKAVEGHHPRLIAIDAPLTLPRGLCCLEGSCPCQPEGLEKGRGCERELAKQGIPCYFTSKSFANTNPGIPFKKMVYRAMGLRLRLGAKGYQVIEVYPYATRRRLFGDSIKNKKTTPEGIKFLRERLVSILPSLCPYIDVFGHDLCDAAIAAYTAYLYHRREAEAIGDAEEGAIYIPLLDTLFHNG